MCRYVLHTSFSLFLFLFLFLFLLSLSLRPRRCSDKVDSAVHLRLALLLWFLPHMRRYDATLTEQKVHTHMRPSMLRTRTSTLNPAQMPAQPALYHFRATVCPRCTNMHVQKRSAAIWTMCGPSITCGHACMQHMLAHMRLTTCSRDLCTLVCCCCGAVRPFCTRWQFSRKSADIWMMYGT